MPLPSNVHVSRALTNRSVAYIQSQDEFVAGRVFPDLPVKKQSDVYFIYSREDWLRDEMKKVAAGQAAEIIDYDLSTGTYYCEKRKIEKRIPDEEYANSDDALKPQQDATDFLTQKALINKERRFMTNYFASGVWTTEHTGVAATPSTNEFLQFDNADAYPIKSIKALLTAVKNATGFRPNKVVMGEEVFEAIEDNPNVIDRTKYTTIESITTQILARLLRVDEVLIAGAVYNAADKGASEDINRIAGKHVAAYYVPKNPGLKVPSAGYTMTWTGLKGIQQGQTARIRKGNLTREEADWVEICTADDMHQVSADLGGFMKDAIS